MTDECNATKPLLSLLLQRANGIPSTIASCNKRAPDWIKSLRGYLDLRLHTTIAFHVVFPLKKYFLDILHIIRYFDNDCEASLHSSIL